MPKQHVAPEVVGYLRNVTRFGLEDGETVAIVRAYRDGWIDEPFPLKFALMLDEDPPDGAYDIDFAEVTCVEDRNMVWPLGLLDVITASSDPRVIEPLIEGLLKVGALALHYKCEVVDGVRREGFEVAWKEVPPTLLARAVAQAIVLPKNGDG